MYGPPDDPFSIGIGNREYVAHWRPVDLAGEVEAPETDCRKLADCTGVRCLTSNRGERCFHTEWCLGTDRESSRSSFVDRAVACHL